MKLHALLSLTRRSLQTGALLALATTGAQAALIATDLSGNIRTVNTTTGTATVLSTTTAGQVAGIAFQPGTGTLFGLTVLAGASPVNSLITINPLTGATTTVGATGLTFIVEGDLAFNPLTGLLYGVENRNAGGSRDFFQLNPLTGAATVLGTFSENIDYSALAFDAAGTLFAVDTASDLLNTLNLANGAILTSVPLGLNVGDLAGLAFDPALGTAYLADGAGTNQLYTVNTTTGALAAIGPLGVSNISGLAFEPSAIPEPTTPLFGAALNLGVVGLSRRRPAGAKV